MTDKQKLIYKEAKDLIAKIACEENIKEQFLVTSQNLKNLVCSKKPIAQSLSGWRYQLCGQPLEQIINK
jgi:ribonuclease D